jgi:phosphoglucomutase
MTGIAAKVVATQPISGQKPGTSGLRKKVTMHWPHGHEHLGVVTKRDSV